MKWRMILPAQHVPWSWGLWSTLDGPRHFLAENERGEQAYVSLKTLDTQVTK